MTEREYTAWEDRIMDRYKAGEISKDEAGEQIQLLQERFDDSRRRQHGIA